MNALIELQGAKFAWEDGGEAIVVTGGVGSLSAPAKGKEVYLGNACTAARFLATVCTIVQPATTRTGAITGNARMKQRPIGPLVDALRENGSEIDYLESQGCLPLSIAPAGLKDSMIQSAASVSSQYVSSILLWAPYAPEPVIWRTNHFSTVHRRDPLLPNKAASGQLSFEEIFTALSLIGQLPPQKYYLFGTLISHSPSPTLHST